MTSPQSPKASGARNYLSKLRQRGMNYWNNYKTGGPKMMQNHTESWQQIVKKWEQGECVWTAELGGIGPGYEQAIQELLFEILCRWPKDKPLDPDTFGKMPKEYLDFVDTVVHDLDDKCGGFSGAQVGAARATAYQFIHFGYSAMMNKLESDRHILVRKGDCK